MRCSECGRLFAGDTSFQMHRVNDMPTHGAAGDAVKARRCLTPTEMRSIGLKRDYHGRWCRLMPVLVVSGEEEEVA